MKAIEPMTPDPAPGAQAAPNASRLVEEVLRAVRGTSIEDLEIEWEGGRVHVRREPQGGGSGLGVGDWPGVSLPTAKPQSPSAGDEPVVVRSAHVGIFHCGSGEHEAGGRAPKTGDAVSSGDALAEVESLRIRNAIHAPVDGKIAEILVVDGTPVEYGQPLLIIQPAPLGPES